MKSEDDLDADYKPHGIEAKQAAGNFRRKNKQERMIKEEVVIDLDLPKDVWLQIGPDSDSVQSLFLAFITLLYYHYDINLMDKVNN